MKFQPLYVLLSLFLLIGLLALSRELTAERAPYHEGVEASHSYGPADFPKVFDFDPLEGLDGSTDHYPVPPPPLSEDYWPCSDCHDPDSPEDVDTTRRVLEDEHDDIVLHHGDESRWCLDCHAPYDRDKLKLASGEKIPFEQSYRLCGQCHGTIYRDWRAGIHGRRTGYWDGPKRYLLCVHCHWPHAPNFKPLEPLPPPVRPEFLRSVSGEAGQTGEEPR